VSPPDGAVAETPVEMGPAELAAAVDGSAIVRTSTAIDAATTPRPVEEIDPLRLNISGPSRCLDRTRRIAALIIPRLMQLKIFRKLPL
jgi:hypothetical protein